MTSTYTPPNPKQRQALLQTSGEQDRLVRDKERQKITTLSRSKTWILENKGWHPKRVKLGNNSVAWLLSDLLWFIYQQTSQNSQAQSSKKH